MIVYLMCWTRCCCYREILSLLDSGLPLAFVQPRLVRSPLSFQLSSQPLPRHCRALSCRCDSMLSHLAARAPSSGCTVLKASSRIVPTPFWQSLFGRVCVDMTPGRASVVHK